MNKELAEKSYEQLEKFAWFLAHRYNQRGHWCLNVEDVASELIVSMLNCVVKYEKKPEEEFLILARAAMKNRALTLLREQGLTHRALEKNMLSLDDAESFVSIPDETKISPESRVIYDEEYARHFSILSDIDKLVIKALSGTDVKINKRIDLYLELDKLRSTWARKEYKTDPGLLIISRALCLSTNEVKQSYIRIVSIFKE